MGNRDPVPRLDLYRELEVDPAASPETIEAAFRSLMKRHHPDRAGPDGLTRAKRINLAHDWLSDPLLRGRYDAARRATTGSAAQRPTGPVDRAPGFERTTAAPQQPTAQATRRRDEARRQPPPPPRRTIRHATPMRPDRRDRTAVLARAPRRLVAAIALAAIAVLVIGGGLVLMHGSGSPAIGAPQTATPPANSRAPIGPTSEPSPVVATASPTPLPTATPAATMATATPSPRPTPAGTADLRFSDGYVDHFVAALGPGDTCDVVGPQGGTSTKVHGFRIASKASSPSAWTLTLDDITGSWTLGMAFASSPQVLYWFEGTDVGSITGTATGFEIDVTMTGVPMTVRIQGSLTCG